ncbi:glycosyltransferase family 2 protein [Vallitalea sp.]|uniref:glycosyltransferase family 2 protein n=1 Tax=Vallitalea sp. TaxID=1882829 RepID=UPI0025CCFE2F|nr:glycosyltransferase family 2 protein [Vallitalea sp.]MCT4686978.1 glycosyltransferase family 2 protein [Vallitalea sp.]
MKTITILVPCYNEEEVIDIFYDEVIKVINNIDYRFELLFINDGSKDRTLAKIISLRLRDSRVSYVDLSRNYGKEIAMAAGLDYASGDAVIIMDADLQDPPRLIPVMIKEWEAGYDDVYAKRSSRKGESFTKKFTAHCFYRLLGKLAKVEIQEDTGDFRLLNRQAIDALKQFKETGRYTKGLFSLIGFNKKEILFDRDERAAGKTKWNYCKLMGLAIEGITTFTILPLRIATFIGSITGIGAFIYMIYILLRTLIIGIDLPGYASLISIMLFIGSIQLVSIGVLGEYVGRIFNETKNRPLYFINKYESTKV